MADSTDTPVRFHPHDKSTTHHFQKSIKLEPIIASPAFDPGCRDLFGIQEKALKDHGDEDMDNLEIVKNDQGLVTSVFPNHPATDHLFKIEANWKLENQKRNFVLIIEDMQKSYKNYVDYVVPNCVKLVETFRDLKLPIIWTNWNRRPNDAAHGAVDRFYGPQGIKAGINPCYIHTPDGHETVDLLAPKTDEERSRVIHSLHLSKFADLDSEGREIVYPMLEEWGVNTIVLVGAWTDDCIVATVFDAIDKYGYDVVLVSDGMATATIHGGKMFECLCAAAGRAYTADEIVKYLRENPDKVDVPKAPLDGSVRYNAKNQRGMIFK